MFSFFSKKVMNEEAARAFWAWFEEKEEWIRYFGENDSSKEN